MQIDDYPLVLTTEHMCEILGCGREKMYEYAKSKGFPRMQGTRKIRVVREDFFTWMRSLAKRDEDTAVSQIPRRSTATRKSYGRASW